MIYQTAYTDENGKVGGLVEISMVIPEETAYLPADCIPGNNKSMSLPINQGEDMLCFYIKQCIHSTEDILCLNEKHNPIKRKA